MYKGIAVAHMVRGVTTGGGVLVTVAPVFINLDHRTTSAKKWPAQDSLLKIIIDRFN